MATFVTSKARENILARIRRGLGEHQAAIPFPDADKEPLKIYSRPEGSSDEELFAEAFISLGGKFIFCDKLAEVADALHLLVEEREWKSILCTDERMRKAVNQLYPDLLGDGADSPEDAAACVTGCEAAIARTGSFIFSSKQNLGRTSTVYYPVHVVVLYIDQIVSDLDAAFTILKKKYKEGLPSMINLNTGPSRTADIEKTLVVGVHGPAEVFCFLVNTESGLLYR